MYCAKCGALNEDNGIECIKCGQSLKPAQQTYTTDYTFGGLIPYKNTHALVSYYLGVFSAIPCVGIFLGIAALILGIKGLRFAKQHPETKGKVHAWVGILLGGFFSLIYLILAIFFIFIMRTNR